MALGESNSGCNTLTAVAHDTLSVDAHEYNPRMLMAGNSGVKVVLKGGSNDF